MEDYNKQAKDFMAKAKATMEVKLLGHYPYFDDDKESRDVYQITLTRGDKTYTFKFGQSIARSKNPNFKPIDDTIIERMKENRRVKPPTEYDVLAGITKHEVGTFQNFCNDFGYDTDSRKAEKTYFAVQDEYENINKLFSDVIEDLQEIS